VQALQSFVSVLAESTSTASPGVTARKQIQDELDSVLQHLQSIIFSAKSLLLAAGRPHSFHSRAASACRHQERALTGMTIVNRAVGRAQDAGAAGAVQAGPAFAQGVDHAAQGSID
jgi:hypothetical protein